MCTHMHVSRSGSTAWNSFWVHEGCTGEAYDCINYFQTGTIRQFLSRGERFTLCPWSKQACVSDQTLYLLVADNVQPLQCGSQVWGRSERQRLPVRKCSRQVRAGGRLWASPWGSQGRFDSPLSTPGGATTVLTIPGNLELSVGSWLKLPLVETECGFLSARPMASMEWLLLRITRYRERRGGGGGEIFRWLRPVTVTAQGQQEPRGSTLTTTGRELWPESNPDRQRSVKEGRYKL